MSQALQDRGHSPNLGIDTQDFDGTQVKLTDYDAVVMLYNADHGSMAAAGKSALRDYLLAKGRVVTAERFIYNMSGDPVLGPVLPASQCGAASNGSSTTYTQVAPADPIVHRGMPGSFTFSVSRYSGVTGVCLSPVSGATVFYLADTFSDGKLYPGLVGRQLGGGGRIISFSSLAGPFEMQSDDYKRLFVNAVEWAAAGTSSASGALAARPGTVSFNYQIAGTAPAVQSISVSSSGAALSFTTSASTASGGGWLSVSPASGATPATLGVSVNPAGLAPGSYNGTLDITSPGVTPQTVPVTLTVSSGLNVYIFRGGEPSSDNAVSQALQDRGHSPNLGIGTTDFDGTQVKLTDYDAVVMLYNAGTNGMKAGGKSALRDYLLAKGRVVTAERFISNMSGDPVLGPVLPASQCGSASSSTSTTYTQVAPADPIVHRGMPGSFTFSVSRYSGVTGVCLSPVSGATVFYLADTFSDGKLYPGLVGRQLGGGGRIISFSSLAGPFEMQSDDYKRLFVNAVEWAAAGVTSSLVTLIANPGTLSFSYQTGGAAPPAQPVSVSSSGSAVNFTATGNASGGNWLSVTPSGGSTPASLNVSVDPSALAPGSYSGSVTISGSGVSPQTVSVSLTVTPNCGYSISPTSQVFSSTGGIGTIGIAANAGCAWTAASNAPWLTITSSSSGSGSGTLTYSVAANTASASRSGAITVAGQVLSVTQSGTSALFLVGPSPLVFRFKEGAVLPQDQLLFIFGDSPGLSFSETAATAAGGSWLSVAPPSGATPTSPIVTVNPTGLAAGNYQGTVTVRVANANPAVQTVSVNVFVDPAGPAHLGVDPAVGLSFSYTQASTAQTGLIVVSNQGGGSLPFQVTAAAAANGTWLTANPLSGTAISATPVSVIVTADPQGLQPGTYTGTVKVASPSTSENLVVPVTMTVNAVQQTMLLSQTGLSFTAVAKGGSVPPQSAGVLNLGQDVMRWSVSASTLSGGPAWLSATPNSGATDAASLTVPLIDIGVDATGLDAGQYYGQVQVSSPTASNSPQFVSVVLNVLPPGSDPGPVVRPTGLIFTGVTGATSPGSQVVTVSNLSVAPRAFTSGRLTTDGTVWFTHLPTEGTVPPSQPTRILVQANIATLTGGVRRGVLTLLFADGTVRTVNILLVLSSGFSSASSKSTRGADGCTPTRLLPLFSSLDDQFFVSTSWPTAIETVVVDDCGSPLVTGSVVATFSSGDPPLNLVSLKDGRWTGTWVPRSASAAQVTLTLAAEAEDSSVRGAAQLLGTLRSNAIPPQIDNGGVVALLAPGAVFSIFGSRLADGQQSVGQPPFPTDLGGASVLLGGEALPLFSAGPERIDAQAPYDLAVNARHQLIVRHGSSYAPPESVTLAPAQPLVLSIFDGPVAVDANHPAQAGDTLVLNCSGLGAVNPPVQAGAAAPDPPSQVSGDVALTVGGVPAQILSAVLMPGSSGLYQVTAVMPGSVPSGPAQALLTVAGQTSAPVSLAAQ